MTSSNENIFRVTGDLCREYTGPWWSPRTKASDAELSCFLQLRLKKRFSKQSWGWWFETLRRPLLRHINAKACPYWTIPMDDLWINESWILNLLNVYKEMSTYSLSLHYYSDPTPPQPLQPTAAQISMKSALSPTEDLGAAPDRSNKGPSTKVQCITTHSYAYLFMYA